MSHRWYDTYSTTDTILDQAVESVAAAKEPALLMYITTQPSESASSKQDSDVYEMDEPYPSVLHTDLKRDTGLHGRQSNDSDDHMQDGLPLFEKYQFLSPRKSPLPFGQTHLLMK